MQQATTTYGNAAVRALSQIDWGIPAPHNQHCDSVRRHSTHWLAKVGLARDPARMQLHCAIDIPLLAAMTHPWATRSDLALVHDFLAWLFELDDQFDDAPVIRHAEEVANMKVRFGEILVPRRRGESVDDSLCVSLRDLWSRIRQKRTSPSWRQRFVRHLLEYVDSYKWEAENRLSKRYPSEREYLLRRQQTGAVHPCFDLLIPTLGIDFDAINWEDPRLLSLEHRACEIITLSNDLVSYHKESRHGDLHNMVLILMAEHRIREGESIQRVTQMVDENVKTWDLEARELMRRNQPWREELARYLFGLRMWVSGNYLWSLRSHRFDQS